MLINRKLTILIRTQRMLSNMRYICLPQRTRQPATFQNDQFKTRPWLRQTSSLAVSPPNIIPRRNTLFITYDRIDTILQKDNSVILCTIKFYYYVYKKLRSFIGAVLTYLVCINSTFGLKMALIENVKHLHSNKSWF